MLLTTAAATADVDDDAAVVPFAFDVIVAAVAAHVAVGRSGCCFCWCSC